MTDQISKLKKESISSQITSSRASLGCTQQFSDLEREKRDSSNMKQLNTNKDSSKQSTYQRQQKTDVSLDQFTKKQSEQLQSDQKILICTFDLDSKLKHKFQSTVRTSMEDLDSILNQHHQIEEQNTIQPFQTTYFSHTQEDFGLKTQDMQERDPMKDNDSSVFNHCLISQSQDIRHQLLQSDSKRSIADLGNLDGRSYQVFNNHKTGVKSSSIGGVLQSNLTDNQNESEYPDQINLALKFNECSKLRQDDIHRKSLDDVAFPIGQFDIKIEKVRLTRKGQKLKSKLGSNSSTLTKESLQQFLSKANKYNNNEPKILQKPKRHIAVDLDQRSIEKKHSNNNKSQGKTTKNQNKEKTSKKLNTQQQQVLSPHQQNSKNNYQSKVNQKNPQSDTIVLTNMLRDKGQIKKLLQQKQSSERCKANSLIRIDDSQNSVLNSFVGDCQPIQVQRKILYAGNASRFHGVLSSSIDNKLTKDYHHLMASTPQSQFKIDPSQSSHDIYHHHHNESQVSPKFGQSWRQINCFETLLHQQHQQLSSPYNNNSYGQLKSPGGTSVARFALGKLTQIKQSQSPGMSRNLSKGMNSIMHAGGGLTSKNRTNIDFNNLTLLQQPNKFTTINQQPVVQTFDAESKTKKTSAQKASRSQKPKSSLKRNIYNQFNENKDKKQLQLNKSKLYQNEKTSDDQDIQQKGSLNQDYDKDCRSPEATTNGQTKINKAERGEFTSTDDINDDKQLLQCLSVCKSPIGFKKSLYYNQPKIMQDLCCQSIDSKRDKSHLIRILYHVVKFVSIDTLIKISHTSKKFSKIREVKFILNQQFRILVVRGLSTFDRLKYWNYRTRFVYYRKKYRNLYNKIIKEKKSDYQFDISKDLDRTFPQLKHFAKGNLGQDQLERLLNAISIYYKKLGYVQGMNFIVGTIMLSFQSEEDAFWMIISMLVNFKLDQLLTLENDKFKVLCFQIDMFVKAYLPSLHESFKKNDLSSEFYASQWLFTFFSIDLPFDIVYIAMDLFLLEGYPALIRICLALLKLIERKLLDISFDESLVFLKTFGRNLDTDTETFFKIAMSFKIQKQMCKDLETFYPKLQSQEKDNYELEFDQENNKWNLINLNIQDQEVDGNPKVEFTNKETNNNQIKIKENAFDQQSDLKLTAKNANPINAFGNKMQNFLNWFKKGKQNDKNNSDQDKKDMNHDGEEEQDDRSDEIMSDNEQQSQSSHRSADLEDQVPPLHSLIVTPQSQQIKTINTSAQTDSKHHNVQVGNFSNYLQSMDSLNDSSLMNDIREGPRLNLPNINLKHSNSHQSNGKDRTPQENNQILNTMDSNNQNSTTITQTTPSSQLPIRSSKFSVKVSEDNHIHTPQSISTTTTQNAVINNFTTTTASANINLNKREKRNNKLSNIGKEKENQSKATASSGKNRNQ